MKDTFAGGDSAHLNGWAIAKLPDPMLELFEIHFAIIIYIAARKTSSSIIIDHATNFLNVTHSAMKGLPRGGRRRRRRSRRRRRIYSYSMIL
jgi:hypothetical protein